MLTICTKGSETGDAESDSGKGLDSGKELIAVVTPLLARVPGKAR